MPQSRTRIRRHPERALSLPDDAEAILHQSLVAHVGIVEDGRPVVIRDRERRRVILEAMIARYFPGRTAGEDYAPITDREDKATRLIEVRVEEMSAKGRSGGPRGAFDDDRAAPGSAGVHPVLSGA